MSKASESELATLEQASPRGQAPVSAFVVTVIEGPDLGQRFTLDPDAPGPVLVGQSPACAIRLSDRQVSRRHASFDARDGRLYLADTGSTNGTVVNGLAVERAWLVGGEVVRLGSTSLRVERGAPTVAKTSRQDRFGRVIGASAAMRRLYGLCDRIADALSPALIEGEHGTGKELLAESLHELGPRKQGPFVVFDCASQAGGLDPFEPAANEPSALSASEGGTLFVREMAELSAASQRKLEAWLEEQRAIGAGARLGSSFDVRVLASSSRDLDREVQSVSRFAEREVSGARRLCMGAQPTA